MDLIQEIKTSISIGQICSRIGLEISRSGHCKSIYKEDKTPSMYIYQKTNTFHCFATGKGGDIIDLYKDYYNLEKGQAIKELAGIAGINMSVIREHKHVQKYSVVRIRSLFQTFVNEMTEDEKERFFIAIPDINYDREIELTPDAKEYYDEVVAEGLHLVRKMRIENNSNVFRELYDYCKPDFIGSKAYSYLVEKRKLSERVIDEKKIFSIENYSKVNNHFKKIYKMFPEILTKSGLVNDKGNIIFYKHRIMIPYLYNDDIVYIRGRYFDDAGNSSAEGMMKYLGVRNDPIAVNSPKRFYNTNVIRRMIKGDKLYIVEGEFDALAIETMGFNSIAIPGAGNLPHEKKFKKLKDYKIIICGDNDVAGNNLVEKLKIIFNGLDKEVFIKRLPAKDANDFLAA
jgi:DNA primase